MPAYLLKEMSAYVRRYDETYVRAYRRYIEALAVELLPQMVYNDGPVMMIQLENEYGFWYIHDVDYLKDVQAAWIENGITGPFFNADPAYVLSADVRLPGNAIGLNG